MFSEAPELYDLIYQQFKDYAQESGQIAALLERIHPDAESVLDVACGTGEHARILRTRGYEVDGVDIEPAFIRIARQKNPGGSFFEADMLSFDLGRRYDVVMCLFSSIAYVKTLAKVRSALENFRRHLAPRGVVLVEPWFGPGQWHPGSVHMRTAEAEDIKVCRMSYSSVSGRVSVLEFHYLIGGAAGIEHKKEVHELGLFTPEEMSRCFADAGLSVVEHDAKGLDGRGLFIARPADAE
jgi:SAM-dependent methyltransferase